MRKRVREKGKRFVSVALVSLLSLGAIATPFSTDSVQAESDNVEVQILGVNDLHGFIDYEDEFDYDGDGTEERLGGLDNMTTMMRDREAEVDNSLIVHAGDMIGGSPLVSAAFQDEPVVEIMNAMGFDIGTVGNHEFDEGIAELKRMIDGGDHPDGLEGYEGMNFPMIAANVYDTSTGELILDPYYIQEVEGQKIGFIGVATTETPQMIVQTGNENLKVTNEVEAINDSVAELTDQGIESIIVLAHNPVTQSGGPEGESDAAYIAENVDDAVDVIFGAHNHNIVDRVVDNKLIVQAFDYGQAFSDVDISIDPNTGDIVEKVAEIVFVDRDEVTPDAEVQSIIAKYNDLVEEVKGEVVGEAATDIEGGYAGRGEVGDNALGNLIADGMKVSMDADIAMMNGGGIRNDLAAGQVTFGDLFDIQPFGNTLVKFELTGSEIRELMNAQFSSYGPDYSISGFKYTWNYEAQAIVDMMNEDGTPFDEDKTYSIVVNNYMFGGKVKDFYDGPGEIGPVDVDVTAEYVKELSKDGAFTYEAEGRISEVDEYPAEDQDVVNLRIMQTTDIHANVMDYDYYQGEFTSDFGLAKTATLIKNAQAEEQNSLLFDNGDLIQGSPMGDYMAKEHDWSEGDLHPVHQAMNLLDYDAGNYGNHEFNYGLDYLKKSMEGSAFPYVNANVFVDDGDDNPDNDENFFDPYTILDRTVVDEDGEEHTIKVGVIGFVPPQISLWDKSHLEGKVITKGIVETAEKFVPQMKEDGADLVVAIAHSGLGEVNETGEMKENATYALTKVEGINTVLFGHAHVHFRVIVMQELKE
ncbi:hypothetical protein GCM10011351_25930 [Paraliobacillus quinghaiensis]|uniref:2',3'-cyclic-nucleotide 2'-phosphodiesterase n=1 Tax=Paraliobacillus quinghaiensis TaxID=470815 RepID=A0A917TUW7_9BACI|nr:5'-nucleotidase C-terminal domain-containing protein [Paraliobacillus quinghaiensis]GGM38619.1 hypothetical protein GCM10011351_25930 [Paraliobacillus quinghaiensis]